MTDAKAVRSFIRSFHRFRDSFNDEFDPDGWEEVAHGKLVRGGFRQGMTEEQRRLVTTTGSLLESDPDRWKEWAATERWKVYEYLQESDFPECAPHVMAMLDQDCFHSQKHCCFDRSTRDAARRLRDRLESLMSDRPAWGAIAGISIELVSTSGFEAVLDVVTKSGERRKETISHNWEKWRHPGGARDARPVSAFLSSEEAGGAVEEARSMLKEKLVKDARKKVVAAVADAASKGLRREELLRLVDEALVAGVMES